MSDPAEIELLKQPLSGEHPCGENLEDTQLLASFDAYRLFGQDIPFDPVPDWREIKTRTLGALQQSKDVRLLAHLTASALRTDGLLYFLRLLPVAAHWMEHYWDRVYPLIDEDAILRKNALNSMADRIAIIDGLRRAPLVLNRQLGSFSLRDIEIAAGQLAPADSDTAPPNRAQVAAVFAATPLADLMTLKNTVTDALNALTAIETKMRDAEGSQAAPNFDPLLSSLSHMHRVIMEQTTQRGGESQGVAAVAGTGDANGAVFEVGGIRSRQDAIRALDAVAGFFRQNEPSSPVPLFIERAKRLVAKDFLEVLADIAPDAMGQAKMAGGLKDE